MTRKTFILLALLPILAVFNFAIWEKETILRDGRNFMLVLAPLDPRSLMQGDYMRLRYQVAVDAENALRQQKTSEGLPQAGYLILERAQNGQADFVRFHKGEALTPAEIMLPFETSGSRLTNILIRPDSFFFQEGHAEIYEAARFGLFKMANNGAFLLVGLADETGKKLGK